MTKSTKSGHSLRFRAIKSPPHPSSRNRDSSKEKKIFKSPEEQIKPIHIDLTKTDSSAKPKENTINLSNIPKAKSSSQPADTSASTSKPLKETSATNIEMNLDDKPMIIASSGDIHKMADLISDLKHDRGFNVVMRSLNGNESLTSLLIF